METGSRSPVLENRSSVATLQAASPSSPSGAATDLPPPSQIHARGGLHGQIGHGDIDLTGGLPSAAFGSPAALPVMGTHALPLLSTPVAPLFSPH